MNERIYKISSKIIENLHQVISEFQVTDSELSAALDFLTRVGQKGEYQLLSDVIGISVAVDKITHEHEADENTTEHNVEGPLYREEAPVMDPPVNICSPEVDGDVLFFSGKVTSSRDGSPLANTVLDVWQANGTGDYENEDPGQPDYNLRGRLKTDENGEYEFQTIVPGPYDIAKGGPVGEFLSSIDRHAWRPAHIHFKLSHEGFTPLTTMLFIEGDPWIDSDAIGAVKESLILSFDKCEDAEDMKRRGVDKPFYTTRYDFALYANT